MLMSRPALLRAALGAAPGLVVSAGAPTRDSRVPKNHRAYHVLQQFRQWTKEERGLHLLSDDLVSFTLNCVGRCRTRASRYLEFGWMTVGNRTASTPSTFGRADFSV